MSVSEQEAWDKGYACGKLDAAAHIEALEAVLHGTNESWKELKVRIEALEAVLREVIRDIDEYERVNKLAPSPGKTECWQSVANARTALAP